MLRCLTIGRGHERWSVWIISIAQILNAAAGLLRPTNGTVAIFGAPLAGLNTRAGYLFQQDALMPWKTAFDNVAVALERVPEGNPDFRPHPKSMTLSRLAGHVAEIPMWAVMTLTKDELDFGEGQPQDAFVMTSRQEALSRFDGEMTKARAALTATSDADMMKTWTLKNGGRTILAMPKIAVLRGFVMNHMIHHRAQLGVYLRLLDVPVPKVYGPSADEQ